MYLYQLELNGTFGPYENFGTHTCNASNYLLIGHFRNVRGLGKSMVVFRLFEKLKYSNERSTIF